MSKLGFWIFRSYVHCSSATYLMNQCMDSDQIWCIIQWDWVKKTLLLFCCQTLNLTSIKRFKFDIVLTVCCQLWPTLHDLLSEQIFLACPLITSKLWLHFGVNQITLSLNLIILEFSRGNMLQHHMGQVMQKRVLCHMRTTKLQISLRSLISTFVVRCLDSRICILAISNVSRV